MSDPVQVKAAIRAQIRLALGSLSERARADLSQSACAILRQQPVWNLARTILIYSPLGDEIDVSMLVTEAIAAGKSLALPRFNSESAGYVPCRLDRNSGPLLAGRFGILEPGRDAPEVPANQLDLTLVPGVAFDPMGRRVGRGKGFYDRLLVTISGAKCGICFDQQIRSGLPMEPHDIKLDYVVTPTRWFECGGRHG